MADETPRIILQIEFKSLEEFKRNSNNFYMYFMDDYGIGEIYRKRKPFERFQKTHSDLEKEVTEITTSDVKDKSLSKWHGPITKEETWQKLLEAYKLMSQLVYEGDPYTTRPDTNKQDDWYLCR